MQVKTIDIENTWKPKPNVWYRKRYDRNLGKRSFQGVVDVRRRYTDDCCEICGRDVSQHPDVHHRKPVGGEPKNWREQNAWNHVIIVCRDCHRRIHS